MTNLYLGKSCCIRVAASNCHTSFYFTSEKLSLPAQAAILPPFISHFLFELNMWENVTTRNYYVSSTR